LGGGELGCDIEPGSKKHNGVRISEVKEIKLQNYLSGESFSPVPVKF
jgi:hypothetical protein